VYREYFVTGTEPTEYCTLHEGRSFWSAIASIFPSHEAPPPPHVADSLPPPATESVSAASETPPQIVSPPAKKRGFWSRVFGRGKDKNSQKK